MSNVKHGGEAAIKLLTAEQPLVGVAAEFESAAIEELEKTSIASLLKARAIRHLAVADLYYAAIAGADNLENMDRLVRRYGWLNSAAHRQLLAVNEMEQANDDDILDLVLEADNGEDRSGC